MITPKDIERKTMTEEKRREAHNSYFAYYIGRPLSYVLTVPFLYTNIAPNIVTCFSIIFAIIGFLFLSLGQTVSSRLIGMLFFFLWNMGDGIDGNIARYKELKSSNGDLLDTLGGYVSLSLILLGMGNAAYNDINGHIFISSVVPVALGGISAVISLIPRLLMHRKIALNPKESKVEKLKDKSNYNVAKIVVLNICDPAGFQEVIMLIAILFNLCTEFTFCYFILNMMIMIYSIGNMLE